jgi:hypothetical protein
LLVLSRREFLAGVPLMPSILLDHGAARGGEQSRQGTSYQVNIGIFFGLFTFGISGSVEERIDRAAGRYHVVVAGEGPGIANRLESRGVIRGRRLVPTATRLFFNIRGRESRTAITYDHDRGLIEYDHVSHTFLLGRRREVRDLLRPLSDQQVDDVVTAALNYAEGALEADATGAFRTYVVRRARPEGEGLEEVQPAGYRAEIVPLVFRVTPDPQAPRGVAEFDLTRFSSWARTRSPARIAFGSNRRPASIQAELALGTTVRITFDAG